MPTISLNTWPETWYVRNCYSLCNSFIPFILEYQLLISNYFYPICTKVLFSPRRMIIRWIITEWGSTLNVWGCLWSWSTTRYSNCFHNASEWPCSKWVTANTFRFSNKKLVITNANLFTGLYQMLALATSTLTLTMTNMELYFMSRDAKRSWFEILQRNILLTPFFLANSMFKILTISLIFTGFNLWGLLIVILWSVM